MWKWLNRKPSAESEAIGQLGKRYEEMNAIISEQLTKLTRLHYKTGQDVQVKLDRLSEQATQNEKLQNSIALIQEHSAKQQQITDQLKDELIRQLDDFDTICARLQGNESQAWKGLIEQWSTRLLETLANAGTYEIPLLGIGFNSKWAESVGTVSRDKLQIDSKETVINNNGELLVTYQIMEVVRRGFATQDGTVLRKALVITLEEEKTNVER